MKKLQDSDRLSLSLRGSYLVFLIETDDIASLRANVNSYLRLADASFRCTTL